MSSFSKGVGEIDILHRVFHGFGQAKFADGGLIDFMLKPIYTNVPATSKNSAQF